MNTTVPTSDEWMQFYEQSMDELSASSLGYSDATTVATGVYSSESNPSSSSLHSASDPLTPKGSSSKPIRRRSRASKKTPTTLLSANASNFRALVQQFTGCPSPPLSSLGSRRGPINLNFALGSERNQSRIGTSVISSASGNDYHYQQSHQEQLRQQHQHASLKQHQHLYQEQQHEVSFDNVHHQDAFFTTSGCRANADRIVDGFDLDNISLEPLDRDLIPYSNENANDSNYFL